MSQHPMPQQDPQFIEGVDTHEDDDLVDSVDELRWEMPTDRSHYELLGL